MGLKEALGSLLFVKNPLSVREGFQLGDACSCCLQVVSAVSRQLFSSLNRLRLRSFAGHKLLRCDAMRWQLAKVALYCGNALRCLLGPCDSKNASGCDAAVQNCLPILTTFACTLCIRETSLSRTSLTSCSLSVCSCCLKSVCANLLLRSLLSSSVLSEALIHPQTGPQPLTHSKCRKKCPITASALPCYPQTAEQYSRSKTSQIIIFAAKIMPFLAQFIEKVFLVPQNLWP